jgi:creatinine amidohydrolase/Fe(II)-dependent formamide hydrolase-like protein
VRPGELPNALGDPVLAPGEKPDPAVPLKKNGITGDARQSSVAFGKRMFEQRVNYAVEQIEQFIPRTAARPGG